MGIFHDVHDQLVGFPSGCVKADGLLWSDGTGGTEDDMGFSDHEWFLKPCFEHLLGDGVFVDVGAHVGHWALRMAGRASKVIAIEPNPATAQVLRRNIALNRLENVVVVEAAAWDCQDVLGISESDVAAHRGGTRVSEGRQVPVRAIRLDDVLQDEAEISLVKLDAEGSDIRALRGMAVTLKRTQPDMLIEPHPAFAAPEMELELRRLGYLWQMLPEGRWLARPEDAAEREIHLDSSAPDGFIPFSNIRMVGSTDAAYSAEE